MKKTNTEVAYYGKNEAIRANCFSIAFFRPTGSNPVFVNTIPLEAGQTLTLNQNVDHIDVSWYDIEFDSAGGSTNELYVIRIVPFDAPRLTDG